MRRWILLCALLPYALAASPAGAVGTYLTNFERTYLAAKQTRIDACALCHSSGNARNSYGAAFAGAGHSFTAIANVDSDGDGFTNLVEITDLSFPGDAADKPVGSVQVTLEPQGARDAGAQWRVGADGAWKDGGVTLAGVVVGMRVIQFKPVTGWVAPADLPATVLANRNYTATGTYARVMVTVPNVVGKTQAAAIATLTAAGLAAGAITQEYSATVLSGQVLSQAPAAGVTAASGSAVSLKVSKGPQPVAVPNVVGQTQADAATAITGAGLVVGAVTQRHDAAVADGMIISQTPAAGAPAPPGSAVGLLVSQGPGPVTVPNVLGQTQAAATAAITNGGLVPGAVTEEYSATVPAGRVSSQTPAADTQADAGSMVALVLSKGRQPVPVPDVAGMTQEDATAAIAAAGLAVQVNESTSDTVPAGTVISQSPPAGTLLTPPLLVSLTVSSGPPSAGCACLGVQKDASGVQDLLKMLDGIFMAGLVLAVLPATASQQ